MGSMYDVCASSMSAGCRTSRSDKGRSAPYLGTAPSADEPSRPAPEGADVDVRVSNAAGGECAVGRGPGGVELDRPARAHEPSRPSTRRPAPEGLPLVRTGGAALVSSAGGGGSAGCRGGVEVDFRSPGGLRLAATLAVGATKGNRAPDVPAGVGASDCCAGATSGAAVPTASAFQLPQLSSSSLAAAAAAASSSAAESSAGSAPPTAEAAGASTSAAVTLGAAMPTASAVQLPQLSSSSPAAAAAAASSSAAVSGAGLSPPAVPATGTSSGAAGSSSTGGGYAGCRGSGAAFATCNFATILRQASAG